MDKFLKSETGQKVLVSAIEEKAGDLAETILNKIGGGGGEGGREDKEEDKGGLDVSNVLSMVAGKDEGSGGGIAKALGGLFD